VPVGEVGGRYDVVVIGGGPGGAAAATMLARQGRRVLVLERELFPRHHVGESLVGGVFPLFRELGVAERLAEVGFMQKRGSTHIWGQSLEPWSLYFNREKPEEAYSYQVERSTFDQVLLDHAESCGAEVWRGASAVDVSFDDPNDVKVSYRSRDGERGTARGTFLIDASGQRRFMAQHMQLVRAAFDPFFRNLAVYQYFRGHRLLDGVNRYNLFLEAFAGGWFWYIPLHTGEVSVGAVIGQDSLPALRTDGPDRFLAAQIERTRIVRRLLESATPSSDTRVINNFSYEVDRFGGDRFVLVGDAACFTDPMFASGVYLALRSGIQAATALDFALGHPDRWQEAIDLYAAEYHRLYLHARNAVQLIYHGNQLFNDQPFWQARKLDDGQLAEITADGGFMSELHPTGWLQYERLAFGQVPLPEIVEDELGRLDCARAARQQEVQRLMHDFGTWIPVRRPTIAMRRGLGYAPNYQMAEGLIVENGHSTIFVNAPYMAEAVAAADGRRSVRDITADVLAKASPHERLSRQLLLVAGFRDAHIRGLFGTPATV